MIPVWVTRVTPDEVYLTTDHPLAGENLHFDVEIVSLREPTELEKEHGHPHGVDGTEDHHDH
ncbi:MAG: FKBP-type peptidyl-prolyl cis-trans isomerase SlyD [Bradymonadia bacterium]|jgi:FKBP-type peptidyl-prolyl cis-trans isomerase SlyD